MPPTAVTAADDAGSGNDYVAATGNFNVLDGGTGDDSLVAAAGHQGDTFCITRATGSMGSPASPRTARAAATSSTCRASVSTSHSCRRLESEWRRCEITGDPATVLTLHDVTIGALPANDFLLL
jgi:hypothetical protein